jgi:hypothetical protein
MDKLNTTEINEALKDVRNAYRLLALYQKRLLDIVKYASNSYNATFNSGWSKFSNAAGHGNRASIDKLSWDWLSLYLYEFNLGTIVKIGTDKYHFKIVHQADTGFYDARVDKKIMHENVQEFSDANMSVTRLFFVISKNDNGCPMQHMLNGNLKAIDNNKIVKENWLAVPYNLQRFSSQMQTDSVLNEFNAICKETFGINLITIK